MCTSDLVCTCVECCPDEPGILIFMHCSGRLKLEPVPPGQPSAVLAVAEDLVSRQVGGARHHLLRISGEPLFADSPPVQPSEHLLVVLHGASFHLSPLCSGSIAAQFPLPRYASGWLDVPTVPTSVDDYVDAVLPDGSPPPLPDIVYAVAFSFRHDQASPLSTKPSPRATLDAATGDASCPPASILAARDVELATDSGGLDIVVDVSAPAMEPQAAAASTIPKKRKSKRASSGLAPAVSVGMCGFTADECALLLDHGTRPWDEDAEEILVTLKRKLRAAEGVLV